MGQEKTTKQKLEDKIREDIPKIIIAIVSAVYIFEGVFSLVKKEGTILSILGNIGLSIVVGVSISSILKSMGLKDGRKSQIFEDAIKAYGDTKTRATKYFDRLSLWCQYKNKMDLEAEKRDIILTAGLSWKGFMFGYYEEHPEKLSEEQKIELKKAKTCSIEKLKSRELLSDSPTIKGPKKKLYGKFGKGENAYLISDTALDVLCKVAVGVICGLYTLTPIITGEVLAKVIWNTLQVLMWLAFGIIKYSNSKYFMEYEYRQTHIIAKTEYLNEFIATMEAGVDVGAELEKEEIDKWVQEFINERESATQIEEKSKEDEVIQHGENED